MNRWALRSRFYILHHNAVYDFVRSLSHELTLPFKNIDRSQVRHESEEFAQVRQLDEQTLQFRLFGTIKNPGPQFSTHRRVESGPEQVTPTSSKWPQLCFPQGSWGHAFSIVSLPEHWRLDSHIGWLSTPLPSPPLLIAESASPSINSRHTTWASLMSQPSSQMVPQALSRYTSTRPSKWVISPINLI